MNTYSLEIPEGHHIPGGPLQVEMILLRGEQRTAVKKWVTLTPAEPQSSFCCPECNGPTRIFKDQGTTVYRCDKCYRDFRFSTPPV